MTEKKSNCKKHGFVNFTLAKNRKGEWLRCSECRREQCRKASEKRRKNNVAIQKYQREYSASYNKIRKCLSLYLTMILIASGNMPE